jgi:hypothetical protein
LPFPQVVSLLAENGMGIEFASAVAQSFPPWANAEMELKRIATTIEMNRLVILMVFVGSGFVCVKQTKCQNSMRILNWWLQFFKS